MEKYLDGCVKILSLGRFFFFFFFFLIIRFFFICSKILMQH